ncbi:MAG TPA: hypothetical protein VK864_07835, partial [Longimicrobiales bacterium]|nr:hypothetical protein [Longimicrobiales bacterium]
MKHRYFLVFACIVAAGGPIQAQQQVPVTPPPSSSLPRPMPRFEYTAESTPRPGFLAAHYETAPQPMAWYQGDPADSLYRAAHAYFSRQEYRRAAERFSDVRSKYPSSRYFCDAAYYEAFARYRLGRPDDLRTGYRVLAGMGARCSGSGSTTPDQGAQTISGQRVQYVRSPRRLALDADVPELMLRINGALARAGDTEAAERVKRAASEGQNVCDREDRNVKIEALSALAQMDSETAKPVLRDVLNLKDVCSAPVRRQAITLVARR